MGTSSTKLRLFVHKVSFIINTHFPPLRQTPYAGRVKLFAEASKLSRTLCFSSSSSVKRRPRSAPSRGQKYEFEAS
jgi:hypothetical protein